MVRKCYYKLNNGVYIFCQGNSYLNIRLSCLFYKFFSCFFCSQSLSEGKMF